MRRAILFACLMLWACGAKATTWYTICDDNFSRPNTAVGATPGTITNNWNDVTGSIYQVNSNQLYVSSTYNPGAKFGPLIRPSSENSLNQRTQIYTWPLTDGKEVYRICSRYQDANDYYLGEIDFNVSGGAFTAGSGIKKNVAGTITNLHNGSNVTTTAGHIYLIDFSVVGSGANATLTLNVYDCGTSLYGTPVLNASISTSYTDSAVPSGLQNSGAYGLILSHYDAGTPTATGNVGAARVVTYTDTMTTPHATSAVTDGTGQYVTVNFDTPGTYPLTFGGSGTGTSAGGFAVTDNGGATTISSVKALSSHVTIALSSAITSGHTVVVGYTSGGNGTLQDSAGTPNTVATFSSLAAENGNGNYVTSALNGAQVYLSPGTVYCDSGNNAWFVDNASYFKTQFSGTSLFVNCDVSTYHNNSIAQGVWGQWIVHIDGLQSTVVSVLDPGSGVANILVPLVQGLSAGTHTAEAWFQLSDETDTYAPKDALIARWLQIDAGATFTLPTSSTSNIAIRPNVALIMGDSITKGYDATNDGHFVASSATGNLVMGNYASVLLRGLNAEGGIVGKSGQGWDYAVNAWTGLFPATFNNYMSGISRTFPNPLNYLIVNQGTNDTTGAVSGATLATTVQTWLSAARAAVQTSTWIILIVPFNGSYAANLTSAAAAYTAATGDAKVAVVRVDQDALPFGTGFVTVDNIHPSTIFHALFGAAVTGKIYQAISTTIIPARRLH